MDDAQLEELSHEVDQVLVELCVKYGYSPLDLAAVVSARMAHLCKDIDCLDEFSDLLMHISLSLAGKPDSVPSTNTVQ